MTTKEIFEQSWQLALEEVRKELNNPLIVDTSMTKEQEDNFLKKFYIKIKESNEEK